MAIFYPRALVLLQFVLDLRLENRLSQYVPAGWEAAIARGLRAADALTAFPLPLDTTAAHSIAVIPQRVRVTRNPYHTADEASVTIDYDRFPFDPRLARAIAVEIHVGAVNKANDPLIPTDATRLFTGYADEGKWRLEKDSSITFPCRDNTAQLIDARWDGTPIDLSDPVHVIIEEIIWKHPATATMEVEVRLPHGESPVLAENGDDIYGPESTGDTERSIWDVIIDLVSQAGLVCWIDGKTLVIAEAQTFQGQDPPTFIYGANIASIDVSRHIGYRRTPPVTCVCWDPITARTLAATYPPDALTPTAPDGTRQPPASLRYTLNRLRDEQLLAAAAKRIFERRSLQDVSIRLKTHDMTGLNDLDLLALRAGDPIRVLFSPEEQALLHGQPYDARRASLMQRGYNPAVASAIAGGYDRISPLYQINAATHELDPRNGYTLNLEAASYIAIT